MRRKKTLLIAVVILLCVSAVSLTAAYLTRRTTAENVITFGSLQMRLTERTLNAQGEEIPFDDAVDYDITHAAEQDRIVRVENVGKESMFVRVSLKMTGTAKDGATFPADEMTKYILNETDWADGGDGWYYYLTPVEPGMKTEELMTKVIFDISTLSRDYPGSRLHLDIDAQALQSEHNGSDPLHAQGWPDTQGGDAR